MDLPPPEVKQLVAVELTEESVRRLSALNIPDPPAKLEFRADTEFGREGISTGEIAGKAQRWATLQCQEFFGDRPWCFTYLDIRRDERGGTWEVSFRAEADLDPREWPHHE